MILFELFYLAGVKSYGLGILICSLFNRKAAAWVKGRKHHFTVLRKSLQGDERRIWFHCPSLGEFEQGRPVLESIRKEYPDHKIVLTFFSPSGYEVRKNDPNADYVFYMPLDGPYNSPRFISLINPELAFFVKYDFWHYYIRSLREKKIPSYFISCIFRPSQIYFKWYGIFFEKILRRVTHLFVQDQASLALLYKNSISTVSVSGDTRFDRVYERSLQKKNLPLIEKFKGGRPLLVAGSTWPPDEEVVADAVNDNRYPIRWIIAPHEISEEQLLQLEKKLKSRSVRYSSVTTETDLEQVSVLIIDNIGMLASLYAYADVAYIGGGFGKGIHNILEAAVYGIPVVFGPKYGKFQEARDLIQRKGAFCIKNKQDFRKTLADFQVYNDGLAAIRKVNTGYVMEKKGATEIIMSYLKLNH